MTKEKDMAEMVRVNTRISTEVNEWLDNESKRSGVPKSTLIFLALESYMTQKIAMRQVNVLAKLVDDIETLKTNISDLTRDASGMVHVAQSEASLDSEQKCDSLSEA